MKEADKGKEQLKKELLHLRQRLAELEARQGKREQSERQRELTLNVLELLNKAWDLTEIKHQIILFIKEFSGCEAVGIRLQVAEDFPYLYSNGFVENHVQVENLLCTIDEKGEIVRDSEGTPVLECMCGNIIRGRFDPRMPFFTEGGSFWTNSTTELLTTYTEKELLTTSRNRCHTEGYESLALIPIKCSGANIGLLQLNDRRRGRFTPELVEFYEGIAQSIGVILARKRVEEALRESEQKFRELTDLLPQTVFEVDDSGCFTFANRNGFESTGYTQEDIDRGLPALQMFILEDRDKAGENMRRVLNGEVLGGNEYTALRKDGTTFPVIVYSAPVVRSNKPVGLRGIVVDITELRKVKEQLQHSQILASLGEMTAGIAHEVNNPLSSILLYAEVLMASDVPSPIKKDLKVIHDEAKRAAKIMTDLLTYGRRTKPQIRRLDLHGIIKKVLTMRRYQERVQNITVSTKLVNDPLYVEGDSSQLIQVFINLLLNAEEALKESKGGKIIISTQIDGKWAKVSVADNGAGIPVEKLEQVFYPFFTTRPVGEGTGLGLSTCYGIVAAHSGLIHAENNEMGGATITVELPLANTQR